MVIIPWLWCSYQLILQACLALLCSAEVSSYHLHWLW
uniref:Uncharacterized protein n=1 Tax=Arundo donax TaxID=35708 RepID=A0A0A8Y8Y1_ARUDO